jgi:ethanolamine ammonia-lyase large subunit
MLPIASFQRGITQDIKASCFICYKLRNRRLLLTARKLARLFDVKGSIPKPKTVILCRSENRELSRDEQVNIYADQLEGLAVGSHVVAVNVNKVMRLQIAAAGRMLGGCEFREDAMPVRRRKISGEVCLNESKIWRTK